VPTADQPNFTIFTQVKGSALVIFVHVFDTLVTVAHEQRTLREYWVAVRIDGHESVIRRVADGPESAGREFLRDLHRGGRQLYETDSGKITVEWGNVATLEVGEVVRSNAIVPGDPGPPAAQVQAPFGEVR
jgi:hypothetical protein